MKKSNEVARAKRRPLTLWDRQYILQMRDRGFGIREIARRLGRNHSIVSRCLIKLPYSPHLASLSSLEKAREMEYRAKLQRSKSRMKQRLKSHEIRCYVEDKLKIS